MVVGGTAFAALGAVVALTNLGALPRLRPGVGTSESVTVVVPARNEADRIVDVIDDLRAQRGVPGLTVRIVDDGSSDATGSYARAACGDDPRFTVLEKTDGPPPGWTGKSAACAYALRETNLDGGIVVFVDADVRLAPDAIAASAVLLRQHRAAMVSPWPFQVAGSIVERLVQPLLLWSWFSILPVAIAHRTRRPSMGVACGQFLAFDARIYSALGGHAAVAGDPTEDLGLARHLRRAGHRTLVAAAGQSATCRMYTSVDALRGGYTRWLWSAFGSPVGTCAVVAAYTVGYLIPPSAALVGRGATRRWGLAGTAAAIISRLVARRAESGRRLTGGEALDSVAHPLSVLAFTALTGSSVRKRRTGAIRWKDRAVP